MSGEKSGYLRWDLKFLLGEVGFSNAEQKKNNEVPMKDLPGGQKKNWAAQHQA